MKKNDIKELTKKDLIEWLENNDIKPYRAGQIFKWLYMKQANSFEEMTDISKKIHIILSDNFTNDRLEIEEKEISNDGTTKYLFKLNDNYYSECVLIPGEDRNTLCISTQVGCAQGCKFCLTSKGGIIRNLRCGEILSQIRDVQFDLTDQKITNLVFMGMGEPFANSQSVLDAISAITDTDHGMKFSPRKVTVSTCGLVPEMIDFGKKSNVNLAVSLNATDNKTRDFLMPINRKYPIEVLFDALKKYPLAPRKRITIEYILIKGINDSNEDAMRLIKLMKKIKGKLNLIPFNEHPKSQFRRPDNDTIEKFLAHFHKNSVIATIRKSMGQDISAACGQLDANKRKLSEY
ncbi:MAG: 23S rRNA (adenine(2503)-C(2))-methyltransferase RlmN [Desulfobacterales bacterium]|nr:23S rRNA (adenine(2503)-C(2))-methyltransferase RlmN [Desulfobacterales bacterium]MCP4160294.1 23S rRNA (adenine(2503)-C(2))-methyltransferase RlmN [Deltaproteobacteria bacterium]